MFETFQQNFPVDSRAPTDAGDLSLDTKVPGLKELLTSFGGGSFKQGLYRIVRAQDVARWNARVSLGFPEFTGRITCFGYDWQGTAFAVDTGRLEQGEPGVVMFEPDTGEALQIPCNVRTFHDIELIEDEDAILASDGYAMWREAGGAQPAYAQCIGSKKPLFLGGEETIENLELSDLDVYWHIMGQIIAKVKGLPPGTPVRISP
ncbi:T6SS immunity protein Tdi1 domain-containing protein [Mesorhizobium sp. M0496]|uniref:T6SS immunity protein Tdi1 domain-containing protein n=1 Tax=Mesorhizobium sp. M0496 TaxID=2956952 RepID=UPI0033356CAC